MKESSGIVAEISEKCIAYYIMFHVSEMREKNELENTFWSIGQDLYHSRLREEGSNE